MATEHHSIFTQRGTLTLTDFLAIAFFGFPVLFSIAATVAESAL